MMITALALGMLAQEAMILRFTPVGDMVYRETFSVSETTAGKSTISATGDRRLRIKVREISRGRARMELTAIDVDARGAEGLASELRSWLDVPVREQHVNERGFVEHKEEPRGNRPFFGVVLPPPGNSMPDRWNAKLLLPIGSDRSVDFKFELEQIEQRDEPVLRIRMDASDRQDDLSTTLKGHVFVSRSGTVLSGEVTTLLVDSSAKTDTTITYRFQKL